MCLPEFPNYENYHSNRPRRPYSPPTWPDRTLSCPWFCDHGGFLLTNLALPRWWLYGLAIVWALSWQGENHLFLGTKYGSRPFCHLRYSWKSKLFAWDSFLPRIIISIPPSPPPHRCHHDRHRHHPRLSPLHWPVCPGGCHPVFIVPPTPSALITHFCLTGLSNPI